MTTYQTLTVRASPETVAEIKRLAAQEKRTESQMVRILLDEALAARGAQQ